MHEELCNVSILANWLFPAVHALSRNKSNNISKELGQFRKNSLVSLRNTHNYTLWSTETVFPAPKQTRSILISLFWRNTFTSNTKQFHMVSPFLLHSWICVYSKNALQFTLFLLNVSFAKYIKHSFVPKINRKILRFTIYLLLFLATNLLWRFQS